MFRFNLVLQSLKLPPLMSFLSSHQIHEGPKTFRIPITPYQEKCVPTSATRSPDSLDHKKCY